MGGSQPAKDLSPWELDPDAPQNARSGIHDVVNSRSGIQAMTSQISRTALMTGWSSDTGRKTALRRYHVGSVEGATVRVPDRFTEHAPLHGRAVDRSVVDGLLAGARAGRSGVLVVRGDPGIGKTALLDYAAAAAGAGAWADGMPGGAMTGGGAPPGRAGMGVLRGAGAESEAELSFAGLHVLLGSALDRRFALPQPQRDALDGAFGLRCTESCDRFLVGLAVLSLLAELAEDGPLLCLVDDAHWLDRSSAEALVFAARRLGAEGIAVIFTARSHDQSFPATGLPVLRLGGLDEESAAELLGEHGPGLSAEIRG